MQDDLRQPPTQSECFYVDRADGGRKIDAFQIAATTKGFCSDLLDAILELHPQQILASFKSAGWYDRHRAADDDMHHIPWNDILGAAIIKRPVHGMVVWIWRGGCTGQKMRQNNHAKKVGSEGSLNHVSAPASPERRNRPKRSGGSRQFTNLV